MCPLLLGRASSLNPAVPEDSREQTHTCINLKESSLGARRGYCGPTVDTVLSCQRGSDVKLQGSSRDLLVFPGPFETQRSGKAEEVGDLNSQCFSSVINLISNMDGLTEPSRRFSS